LVEAGFLKANDRRRRMIRPGIILGGVILLVFLATGCRYTATPGDLLEKPAISEDKQAILAAIEKALPVYSKLTIPIREDIKEAIRLVDVDGDGTMEAIVSYYNEYSTPELMVFKYTADVWKSWVLIQEPLARQIAWLKIEDLDGDGQMELMIGWIGAFDSPNVLDIYSFQTKPIRNESGKLMLEPIESLPYTYAETGDINDDGAIEIAVISELGTKQEYDLPEYDLTLYNWKANMLHKWIEVPVSNDVNSYERLIFGRVSPRHNGIILEGTVGAHSSYTAMYAWENGKLRLIYPMESSIYSGGIIGTSTYSYDINGDGIIELHWTSEAPGYPDTAYAYSKWINEWMQWDGQKSFVKITEEFSDYGYGIQLRIPEQWIGRYTMRNTDDELYAVVEIDYWNKETDHKSKLATLYAVPQKQWENVESEWRQQSRSSKILLKDSGNVYAISFEKEAPIDWSAEERQAFSEMMEVEDQLVSSLTVIKN